MDQYQGYQTISAQEFDPVFDKLNKDWMLISASDGETANTMTASWGGLGVLWNKPVAICYIRPQRFTCPIVESATHLTLSFLPEQYRAALNYCGSHSGSEGDKFKAAGITCQTGEHGVPYPAEADVVLICRKLYADEIKEDSFVDQSLLSNYKQKDYHRFYICEIERVLKKI